jgi:hypothetical protein
MRVYLDSAPIIYLVECDLFLTNDQRLDRCAEIVVETIAP